jgi:hypothetical protein
MYIHIYIHTYVHTYIYTYIPSEYGTSHINLSVNVLFGADVHTRFSRQRASVPFFCTSIRSFISLLGVAFSDNDDHYLDKLQHRGGRIYFVSKPT